MITKCKPGNLTEQAIEVMRQSIPEPGVDGKACPPIAPFAHCLVQKLLKPDNGPRPKGMP